MHRIDSLTPLGDITFEVHCEHHLVLTSLTNFLRLELNCHFRSRSEDEPTCPCRFSSVFVGALMLACGIIAWLAAIETKLESLEQIQMDVIAALTTRQACG